MSFADTIAAHVSPRGGALEVLRTLGQRPGTIAYLGSSVTAQADGYRSRLHGLLEDATGQRHREINAGIGAAGTVAGLFLLDEFVIRHQPDLCFVEFVPTDLIGYSPEHLVGDALRAIVERLRANGCEPVFLYLDRRDFDSEQCRKMVSRHEEVASDLAVDSVDVVSYFRTLGEATVAASYKDAVHLTGDGAQVVAVATAAAVLLLRDAEGEPQARAHRPPGPLAGARLQPVSLAQIEQPERARARRFRFAIDCVDVRPDTRVQVDPGWHLHGLVFIAGPGTGIIRVTDDAGTFALDLWDPWCRYERLKPIVFPRPCDAATAKTIDVVGRSPQDTADAPARLSLVGFMAVP